MEESVRVSCCICMDCISAGQNEMHTTELPSSFEVEIVSSKVQITGRALIFVMFDPRRRLAYRRILFEIRKHCLRSGRNVLHMFMLVVCTMKPACKETARDRNFS
jgi:hypothetical protein